MRRSLGSNAIAACFCFLCFAGSALAADRQSGALSVGYADVDITPPLGTSMPGGFQDRKATGVLDSLLAKVVYLQLQSDKAVIIACDLLGIEASEIAKIRKGVERHAGIPAGNVWVQGTHTHAGGMVPRRFTSDELEILGRRVYQGDPDMAWIDSLPERIGKAAAKAVSRAKPESAITLSVGEEPAVAFYRRFRMKDGSIRTNPGRGNPKTVEPSGKIDPRVWVVRFPEAKTLLVNFGLHPAIVTGTKFSADFPGHMTETIRQMLGKDWNVLFLNAFCGNINHVDVNNRKQRGGDKEATRIGKLLGKTVLDAMKTSARPIRVDRLGVASRTVQCRIRSIPEADRIKAEKILNSGKDPRKFRGAENYAAAAMLTSRTQDKEHSAEIAAMRIGPIGLVAMPGEILVELGCQVQADSPFGPTLTVNMANGSMGYIAHAAAYEEGGYETSYRSARYASETGGRWAEAAVELLKELAK